MNVVIAIEYRFDRTPDGAVWTGMTYPRPYWNRYLEVFESVTVLARAREVPEVPSHWQRVDGGRVRVHVLPHYVGPWGFIRMGGRVKNSIREALAGQTAAILRVPGVIGAIAARVLEAQGRDYGLEVVGDPWDVFAPGANHHPLRPLFRWWFARDLRRLCRTAGAVLYVTESALQARYARDPRKKHAAGPEIAAGTFGVSDVDMTDYAFVASNVEMSEEAFATSAPSSRGRKSKRLRLLCVAAMDQPYKGHATLLDAFSSSIKSGMDLELTLVGDGRLRPAFEAQARKLGVMDRIRFLGQLPAGARVQQELDSSDLFVLPSLVEGMPRALIEAMGRSLPCIGSRIGGIPELLPAEALVTPGSAKELAGAIGLFFGDSALRASAGKRNLEVAKRYHERVLGPRRVAFYEAVKGAARSMVRETKA